ncbi:RNA-directed DNA polymerase, eukaryota [Tanacetum coccineum]
MNYVNISSSFRRHVRGGVESQQLDQLSLLLDTVILSNMDDRWFWDLNGEGVFQVKDVRSMLDEAFLPKMEVPTRWIKSIPIKVNVFAWKLYLDRLPTRSNLSRRNVSLPSLACPLCDHVLEDSSHLFFGCSVAKDIQKLICRWWNLDVHPYESYEDWLSWFKSIRLGGAEQSQLDILSDMVREVGLVPMSDRDIPCVCLLCSSLSFLLTAVLCVLRDRGSASSNQGCRLSILQVVSEPGWAQWWCGWCSLGRRYEKGGIIAIVEGEAHGGLGLRGGLLGVQNPIPHR